jgi:uncharacterized membrane protein YcaP (DUF421 family)
MEIQELLATAGRSLGLYVLMLVVIRLLRKRTVGNFTAFDFLVALMLGEVVDEIIYADVTFLQGSVAILVIAGAKYATSWLSYFDHGLNALLEGKPRSLLKHGEIDQKGLRAEIMNEKDLLAALRLHGIDDVREVKLAVMEVDGLVSVIKEDWAEPVQKGDVLSDQAKNKPKNSDEPPEDKRTDSPRALGLK